MKKAIALILCAVMATASFAACSANDEQSAPASTVSTASEESVAAEESSEIPQTVKYFEKI